MTAYETPTYGNLEDILEASKIKLKEAIDHRDDRLAAVSRAQKNLDSWVNAGNSDMATKMSKIQEWKGYLKTYQKELEEAEKNVAKWENQVDRDERALNSFVTKYNALIAQGESPESAEQAGKAAAESGGVPAAVWVVLALIVAGIGTYLIVRAVR